MELGMNPGTQVAEAAYWIMMSLCTFGTSVRLQQDNSAKELAKDWQIFPHNLMVSKLLDLVDLPGETESNRSSLKPWGFCLRGKRVTP